MTVDVDDFEHAIMNSGVSGEYYGEYAGRGGHRGFAVSLDDESGLFALGVAFASDPLLGSLQDTLPHVDSLGRGIIASWPARLFSTTEDMQ